MVRRTVTALLLLALILPTIYLGGIPYFFLAGAFIIMSSWEYARMFRLMNFEPSLPVTVGGTLIIIGTRAFWPEAAASAFAGTILAAMLIHLLAYERGRDPAALDFATTAAGLAYLGWIGAYMLDLRNLPGGAWWVLFAFAVVWIADSCAYFVGVKYGRHKMLKRLSPNKSWEGYVAGILGGSAFAGLLAFAYAIVAPVQLKIWQGLALGFVLSAATILGDLGESLFKRFSNEKDSGSILPGHGGAFDRIDSLIWAAVIGYHGIRFFLS